MGKGHREVDSRWLFTFRRVLEAGGGGKKFFKDWGREKKFVLLYRFLRNKMKRLI